MNKIRVIVFLGILVYMLLGPGGVAATANPWYIVVDPVGQINGLIAKPGLVIELNAASGSFTEFSQIVSTPIEIDGFELVNDDTYYFSVNMHANLGTEAASPGDVFLIDTVAGTLTRVFEAAANGIPDGVNVDAITIAGNNDLVISIDTHANLGGSVYDDADLIRFSDSGYSLFADGNDLGLDDAADIDAVTRFSRDRIVISTRTGGTANGIGYDHSDLLFAHVGETVRRIELSLSQLASTTSDLRALSGIELPDALFQDRFESD